MGCEGSRRRGLSLVYCEVAEKPELPMPESALDFHRLQQAILRTHDLAPFRFPTLLPIDQLAVHLEEFAPHYDAALQRIAGCVQMEIELEMEPAEAGVANSGTEYLRRKATRTARCGSERHAQEGCGRRRAEVADAGGEARSEALCAGRARGDGAGASVLASLPGGQGEHARERSVASGGVHGIKRTRGGCR